eukprot:TRINITY_DN29199_c0_g1_i1.p1 TRINITY_DN29199_c0_g1~~TRINITY_DN29199_c0_g1_i1.p1  ORF type:complete len:164 (-),score=20.50 TRINITY_DN29199_c0_g1_i1:71-562(-)
MRSSFCNNAAVAAWPSRMISCASSTSTTSATPARPGASAAVPAMPMMGPMAIRSLVASGMAKRCDDTAPQPVVEAWSLRPGPAVANFLSSLCESFDQWTLFETDSFLDQTHAVLLKGLHYPGRPPRAVQVAASADQEPVGTVVGSLKTSGSGDKSVVLKALLG